MHVICTSLLVSLDYVNLFSVYTLCLCKLPAAVYSLCTSCLYCNDEFSLCCCQKCCMHELGPLCTDFYLYHRSLKLQRMRMHCISQKTAHGKGVCSHTPGVKNSYTLCGQPYTMLSQPYTFCGLNEKPFLWYKPVIPLLLRGLADMR